MAAAADPIKKIKEEATCPICLELFRDPVTSACGHSFCWKCIAQVFQGCEAVTCPQCRRWLQKRDFRTNRDLKNIAEILRSQAAGKAEEWNLCEKHRQPLQLYCKQDQSPICLVCMQSQDHRGHMVVPMDEALQEYRGKMAEQLGVIESSCGKLHQFVNQVWKHLPQNAQDEERQNLARVCEKLRVLQVHTGTPRQRFADPVSQTQSHELSRGSLDEAFHSISGTRGDAWYKVRTGTPRKRFADPASQTQSHELSRGSLDEAFHSISGTRGDDWYQVRTGIPRQRFADPASQTQSHELSRGSLDETFHSISGTRGVAWYQADALSREPSLRTLPANPPVPTESLGLPFARPLLRPPWEPGVPPWKRQRVETPANLPFSPQHQGPVRSRQHSEWSGPPDLQGCAVEVTLDPATAHPWLVLSEDWKSVELRDTWQDLPNNPERFDTCISVLGSEGFSWGRCYWEVEVGPRGGWTIGVARDSVQRKGRIQLKPHVGIWALDSSEISQVPRKVGVYVDYEGGEVRFYNAETMALIFSRTETFTGRLVPFFHLWAVGSRLSLSPSQR